MRVAHTVLINYHQATTLVNQISDLNDRIERLEKKVG